MVKLSIALVALTVVALAGASVDVYPEFLTSKEIEHFLGVQLEPSAKDNESFGIALLDQSLAKRVHKTLGMSDTCRKEELRRSIPVSVMTSTTDRHRDAHWNDDGTHGSPVTKDERVGFFFLETNKEGGLSHGDDTFVPAEAGSLVVFDGSTPHNTIVKQGSVSMAGAFDVSTFAFVGPCGGSCYEDDHCCEDEVCDCNGPDRNLLETSEKQSAPSTRASTSEEHKNLRKLKRERVLALKKVHDEALEQEEKKPRRQAKSSKECTEEGTCRPKQSKAPTESKSSKGSARSF